MPPMKHVMLRLMIRRRFLSYMSQYEIDTCETQSLTVTRSDLRVDPEYDGGKQWY